MKFYIGDKVCLAIPSKAFGSCIGQVIGYNYDHEDYILYQIHFEDFAIDDVDYIYENELILIPTANDILKGML